MDSIINLILRGQDDGASSTLERVSGSVGGLGGVLQQAAGFAVGGLLVNGIGAVTGAMGDMFAGMVGGNAAFEQYETQFGVLLGSTEAAQERMEDLAAFGASTPFELPGVVQADMILQGFGLHSEEAAAQFGFAGEEIRTIAGDVASGTGSSFEEMAGLIGRFSAGATGEAISRMQEMGITTRAELADMGLEFSNSGQLLSPLPEAMQVVLGLMQDKYGGMMQAQSQTFTGMMSNLEDWKAGTLRAIGAPIFEVLKDKLGDVLAFLGSPAVVNAVSGFASTLANGIGSAIDWLSNVALPAMQPFFSWLMVNVPPVAAAIVSGFQQFGTAVAGALPTLQAIAAQVMAQVVPGLQQLGVWGMQIAQAVMPVLSAAWAFLMNNMNIILPVLAAVGVAIAVLSSPILMVVGLVVGLATAWANNWGGIQEKTQAVTAVISSVITTVFSAIKTFWDAHGEAILAKAQQIWTSIQTFIQTAITTIQTIVTTVATALGTFWDAHGELVLATATRIWTTIKDYISGIWDTLSALFAAFKSAFEGDWQGFGENLRLAWETAWQTVVTYLGNLWSIVAPILAEFVFAAINYLAGIDWGEVGSNIISGIASGITSAAGFLQDAIVNAIQAAVAAATGFLDSNSPSRLTADLIGKPFGEGIGKGAEDEIVSNASDQIKRSIGLVVNDVAIRPVRGGPTVGSGFISQQERQPVTIHHIYHVKIEDTRSMALFLDYLENVSGKHALEALG